MKSAILFILIYIASIPVLKSQSVESKDTLKCATVSVDECRNILDSDHHPVLVDVRSRPEFRMGRIPGAINVPVGKRFKARMKGFNKDKRIILYCTSGVRSCRAAMALAEMGYGNALSLKGGISAWKKEGLEVVKK